MSSGEINYEIFQTDWRGAVGVTVEAVKPACLLSVAECC